MQTIDINTTQNVEIQYELASLLDRIFAFIIDSLVMWFGAFLFYFFSMLVLSYSDQSLGFYFTAAPIVIFYSLVSEVVTNGQSIGKKLLKIKIVKLDGKEPAVNDYLLRWVFRPVDIYLSLGTIACMLISSSEKRQRIGDILANTSIIKTSPERHIHLDDILKIDTLENYQPTYPEIRKFPEEDMLVVMDLLKSHKLYPNQAHNEALDMMAEKIQQHLNLQEIPDNKREFLTTILKDYIVTTR